MTVLFGFIGLISLSIWAIISGVLQIIAGVLILTVEAPNVFSKVGFMAIFDEKIGKRPFWVRAIFYVLVMIPALIFDSDWESVTCFVLIVLIAVLYAIMSLMHNT